MEIVLLSRQTSILFLVWTALFSTMTVVNSTAFLPFGLANRDSALPKQDDAFTDININTDFSFFGQVFRQVHISTNGIIYFGGGSTRYVPNPYPLHGTRSVAAYWVDSDPREGGNIFYRETIEPNDLSTITAKVRQSFVQFSSFTSSWALITTFSNVPRYGCRRSLNGTSCSKVVNHQTILTSNGIHSFAIFLFDRLDYAFAQIGFNAGDGKRFFLVPKSNSVDSGKYALEKSNSGVPGEWVFHISESITSVCNYNGQLEIYPKKVLNIGNQDVHITGPCLDGKDTEIPVSIGTEDVVCNVTGDSKIHCVTRYMNRLGRHEVQLVYKNRAFNTFLLAHDLGDRSVKGVDTEVTNSFGKNSPLKITWNKTQEAGTSVKMRGIQQNIYTDSQGQIERVESFDIYEDRPNTGTFEYQVKGTPNRNKSAVQGLVVRVVVRVGAYVVKKEIDWSDGTSCDSWYNEQPTTQRMQEIADEESRRNPCPPMVSQARPNTLQGGFKVDGACSGDDCFFHPGASTCYRSTNNPNNIAVQCCYKEDDTLLIGPPGGGTLDMVDSENDKLGHFNSDVWPWLTCCYLTNDCNKYYEKRPSVDSRHFRPPRPPFRASGNLHLTTLDGFSFVFNAVGEFTYLRTPDTTVQCRTTQYLNKLASYFSAFALKVSLEDVIQIELNSHKHLLVTIGSSVISPTLYAFTNVSVDFQNSSSMVVRTASGIEMNFYALNGMLHVVSTMDLRLKGGVFGLVGNWDDIRSNDLMRPDKTIIPINSSLHDINHLFGMSWATTNTTSFFTYPSGKDWFDYQSFQIWPFPGIPPYDPRCQGNGDCLYDLHVTNDLEISLSNVIMAQVSMAMEEDAERISRTCVSAFNVSKGEVRIDKTNETMIGYELFCNAGTVREGGGDGTMNCFNGVYTGILGRCTTTIDMSGVPGLKCALSMYLLLFGMYYLAGW